MNKSPLLVQPPLEIITLENAFSSGFNLIKAEDMSVAIPQEHAHCRSFTSGCIYSAEGEKINLSERIGGLGGDHVASFNPANLKPPMRLFTRKLSGHSLYLGSWMGHYGHFITETLSRLWLANKISDYDRLVAYPFIFGSGTPIKPYQRFFMELLGIQQPVIQPLNKLCYFEKITIREQGWLINSEVNKHIKPLYEKIREPFINEKKPISKLFLSRSDIDYQRVKNISAVEAVFKKRGFDIIYPEKLPIEEQLSLYANCKVMAGFSGSALHNSLFTQKDAFIIDLGDPRNTRMLAMQQGALALMGNAFEFIAYEGDSEGAMNIKALEERLNSI